MMKIIKSVEIIDFPNSYGNVYRCRTQEGSKEFINLAEDYTEEEVYGRFFRTHDGKGVVIGMTKAVESELGLVMDSFRTYQKKTDDAEKTSFETQVKYNSLLRKIKQLKWWERIFFLFKVDVLELK